MATQAEYLRLLQLFLGKGAYSDAASSVIVHELDGLANGLASADANVTGLELELFPETLDVFAGRVEAILGLPVESSLTLAQRRDRIITHLNTHGFRPSDLRDSVARMITSKNPEDITIIERETTDQSVVNDAHNIFEFFVFVDPEVATPTEPITRIDLVIDRQKHAHTRGQFIQSASFLTNDPNSLTDRDILGG